MSNAPAIRHVPEYGWAAFDRKTGAKLGGGECGPWWTSRKAVQLHIADVTDPDAPQAMDGRGAFATARAEILMPLPDAPRTDGGE